MYLRQALAGVCAANAGKSEPPCVGYRRRVGQPRPGLAGSAAGVGPVQVQARPYVERIGLPAAFQGLAQGGRVAVGRIAPTQLACANPLPSRRFTNAAARAGLVR